MEIKPVAFARGVPAEELNGLYGLERFLLENPGESVTVVATLSVDEIVTKELAAEQYPVLKWKQIEPIRSDAATSTALSLMRDAKAARTGGATLDGLDDEPADEGLQRPEPQWDDDEPDGDA
jgi:hypothetical protein